MSDSRSTGREPSLRQSLGLDRHPLTRVKGLALGTAMLMMILGVLIALTTDRPPPPATDFISSADAPPDNSHPYDGLLDRGFAPTRPSAPGGGPASDPVATPNSTDRSLGAHDLSPFMIKGGFGLFIGFAIGFAMRAFLRLAIVATGFYFLVLGLMAYAGWIEIHWNPLENQFSHLLSSIAGQFESFKTFLTGTIPTSGLFVAGFAVGLRRK